MKKTFRFHGGHQLPLSKRRALEFVFNFSLVDSDLMDTPGETAATQFVTIQVSITDILKAMWSNQDPSLDIEKVLFQFAKRHLSEKLREGTLLPEEELWLTTTTQPPASPFESSRIHMKNGEAFEVELSGKPIMEDLTYMQLATKIIETRDYINAVANDKLAGRLLSLPSERDLLQLFREAKTEEDFIYRISALKNIATNLNEELLDKNIRTSKPITGSISLLEAYLKSLPDYDETPIKVLKSINRLRQAYPIHTDTADGVQDAHKFFGLAYPIKNYDEAWRAILVSYSDALKRIFEMISSAPKL
jgi:hypothetical protein